MARPSIPLTENLIQALSTNGVLIDKYDGKGLFLRVVKTGSKTWYFGYRNHITQRTAKVRLGTYPTVSLKDARLLRAKHAHDVANNIDPTALPRMKKKIDELKVKLACLSADFDVQIKKSQVTQAEINCVKSKIAILGVDLGREDEKSTY